VRVSSYPPTCNPYSFNDFRQRKLSSTEYKDVDEEYRVAMIKMRTTKVAAEDLRKYGNALDKVRCLSSSWSLWSWLA
jgi:hypothetical protein